MCRRRSWAMRNGSKARSNIPTMVMVVPKEGMHEPDGDGQEDRLQQELHGASRDEQR